MKFNNDLIDVLKIELGANNLVPFLVGEPAIGKSSFVEDLAQSMGNKCFVLACNQLADKADLTGQRLVPTGTKDKRGRDEYTQVFFPHETIMEAIKYAEIHSNENPILFLDEINRATSDITSACLSLPTQRSIGSYKLPSNLKIIAAGNDKGNITSLDTASLSRFIILNVEPDAQTFLDKNPNCNKFVKATLEKYPNFIFCKPLLETQCSSDENDEDEENVMLANIDDILGDDSMKQFTAPRTIASLSDWLNGVPDNKLLAWFSCVTYKSNGDTISLLQELIEAHVGHTEFALALLNEIKDSLQTLNQQTTATSVTIDKPSCFTNLQSATTLDELCKQINTLTDDEKSSCVLYCIYDQGNNKKILKTLLLNMTQLQTTDIVKLSKAASSGILDEQNLNYAMSIDSDVSTAIMNVINL